MTTKKLPELTRAELAVLKVLWREGEQSAREVHDGLSTDQGWAYSTTRTMLERMANKGLVAKRSLHGLYVYEALVSKVVGLAGVARELAKRVLDLDYAPVVSLFAKSDALSPEEIEELARLLEEES